MKLCTFSLFLDDTAVLGVHYTPADDSAVDKGLPLISLDISAVVDLGIATVVALAI